MLVKKVTILYIVVLLLLPFFIIMDYFGRFLEKVLEWCD